MMLLVNVCVCVARVKHLSMKKNVRSMLGLCYKPVHDESVMY